MDTATAYVETFGCALETVTGDGYEHDLHPGDCRWRFTCGICGTEDLPCAAHAPADVPGLMMTECSVPGEHPRTWVLADDTGYGAPCMYCAHAAAVEAHRGCAHSHHWPWRRWKITGWLLHKGAMAGFVKGGMWTHDGACRGCHSHFRIGRSGYVLGRSYSWWGCVLRRHHRPAFADSCVPWGIGICVKCSPCPGCESCQPAEPAAVARG